MKEMKSNNKLKSLYVVLVLVFVAFAVTKFSSIVTYAKGEDREHAYTTAEMTEAADYLREKLMDREATITFYTEVPQNATVSEYMSTLWDTALRYDPTCPTGGDYLDSNRGTVDMVPSDYSGSPTIAKYTYSVPGTRSKKPQDYLSTKDQEKQVKSTLDAAVASLQLEGKSDYEKAKAIYDYVRLNVTYDQSLTDHSTYSAAVLRKSVCQGYSSMLYYMMLKAGMECRIVTGYAGGGEHAWNIVKISDPAIGTYWYNVDVTWDSDSGTDEYFLLSNNTISDEAHGSHQRNSESAFPDYTMTSVDNPFKNVDGISASLLGCSVFTNTTIYIKYYFDASTWGTTDEQNDYQVVFTLPSGEKYTQTLSYSQNSGGGSIGSQGNMKSYVSFNCNVPARCMSDVVQAQVVSKSDSSKKSEVFRTSVKKYADVLIEKKSDIGTALSEDQVAYVKAMLYYGAHAQRYFKMKPNVYADKGIESGDYVDDITDEQYLTYLKNGGLIGSSPQKMMYGVYLPTEEGEDVPYVSKDSGISYAGSCLILSSDTIIRHYFKLNGEAKMEDYTFKSYGGSTTYVPFEKDGYVCIETEGFNAKLLSDINIGKNGVRVEKADSKVIHFHFNPMDYVYRVLSDSTYSGNTELTNLLKALFWYNVKAVKI